MLLDLTMNKQEVVTEDNIEEILEMMRKTSADEIREASKKEIEEVRRKARGEVSKERERREELAESLAGKEGELADARVLLDRKENDDVTMMQRWARDAANFQRRAAKGEQLLLVGLAVVLAGAGWVLNTDAAPGHAGIIAWVAAALTFLLAIGPIIPGFPNMLTRWIVRIRDRRFRRRIEDAGRADLLENYYVDWESLSVRKR
jgi:hypothetical protein